jgi:(2Fe-2S) ferredoxin/predicted O-methyltransferase YrrM
MEAYDYHVYVCNQKKPEGLPSCSAHGSDKLINLLRAEIMKQGLGDTVQVTTCGSIGLCERGPNMVVYPDGIWYSGVTAKDLPEIVSQHFGSGKVVERLVNKDVAALRTEIDGNKMKMITAMKANDAAGVLPDDLNQRIRGFRESRVILTAIELDVFTAVGKGASSTDVAKRLGSDPRATEMLLNALVALELLEKKEGSFTNSAVSARYLMEGSPDDSRAGLMHSVHLWGRWSTLTDCVREGTSVTRKQGLVRDKNRTESFIAAMHKNATPRAAMVVRTVGTEGIKRMLDVGGGSGAYSIAFAQANPDLHAEVFDLADVTPIAQRHIDQTGISDRVKTRVGDLYTDEFGNGYDLVLISAICHMNSPEENVDMLKKAFGALSSGGRVVIQDFILTPDKTVPVSAALFALNMLVGTRAGSSYSEPEYFDWLKQVGFKDAKLIRMPGPAALIVAKRE